MKRKRNIQVKFANGTVVNVGLKIDSTDLMRDEAQIQLDNLTERLIDEARNIDYLPRAPFQNVRLS